METKPLIDADATINASKIGGYQRSVLILGGLVLFTDGFKAQDIGYLGPAIRDSWDLSQSMWGYITSAGILGLLVGYFLLAPLAGRFGQKRVCVISVGAYGTMSLLAALAQDASQLLVLRFLTGLALASALPAAVALVGEFAPMRRRSSFITFAFGGFSLGQLSAGAASALLLDDYSWRAVFSFGGAFALCLVPALILWMPESLEYLVNRGNRPEHAAKLLARAVPAARVPHGARIVAGERGSQRVSVRELFQNGRLLGTLLIWAGMTMNLIPNYFFGSWLTNMLVDSGFSQEVAIYTKMLNDGAGILAAFLVGPLMDRFGPYRVLTAVFLVGGASVALTGSALAYAAVAPLMIMCVFVGICTSSIQKGSNALACFFYPTAVRSTAMAMALGVGRISAFLAPAAAGIMLDNGWTPVQLIYMASVPMLFGAMALYTMYLIYGTRASADVLAAAPARAAAE